jgi:formylglycine-generating enzyme
MIKNCKLPAEFLRLNTEKYFSIFSRKLPVSLKWFLSCSVFFLCFGACIATSFANQKELDPKQYNPSYKKPGHLEQKKVIDSGLKDNSGSKDTSDMAFIRGGKFVRGSSFEQNKAAFKACRKHDRSCKLWWFSDEYPLKLVTIDSYLIDIYEVTNEKYLEFVKATGHPPALDDSCSTDGCWEGNLWKGSTFPSVIRNQPVTQVSWYDAEAYCKWRGKRLPTEAEWEKAARGPSGSVYPWGTGFPRGRATFKRKWKGLYTMTNVGTYPTGVSVYGVHDMAGNVWEWVSDWYSRTYYTHGSKDNPQGYEDGEFKSLRGGSWVNFADSLRSAFRRWSRPDVKFNDTGFRCAKSAPIDIGIN